VLPLRRWHRPACPDEGTAAAMLSPLCVPVTFTGRPVCFAFVGAGFIPTRRRKAPSAFRIRQSARLLLKPVPRRSDNLCASSRLAFCLCHDRENLSFRGASDEESASRLECHRSARRQAFTLYAFAFVRAALIPARRCKAPSLPLVDLPRFSLRQGTTRAGAKLFTPLNRISHW